ncbi:hypothetical protein F5146DRAFT_1143103 [Armillaria mellea]|nr:hypothetical protein F5146DRAFT_1143103 [Armillaria mellea]
MPQLQSVTCYISRSLFSPLPLPTDAIQTLFRDIALHSTITILDIPLSDLNASEEWLSVNPRSEHLLTAVNSLYLTLSMNARDESMVRERIIESISVVSKVDNSDVIRLEDLFGPYGYLAIYLVGYRVPVDHGATSRYIPNATIGDTSIATRSTGILWEQNNTIRGHPRT